MISHNLYLYNLLNKKYKQIVKEEHLVGGKWKDLPQTLCNILLSIKLKDFRKIPEFLKYFHDGIFSVTSFDESKFNPLNLLLYRLFVKKFIDIQVKRTEQFEKLFLNFYKNQYSSDKKVHKLIEDYNLEDSNKISSKIYFTYKNKEYTPNYIEELNRFDCIYKNTNLKEINSMIEIGGGFGSNIHIHLQNLKKLKKILIVDIFPVIYLSTQYLKSFYGNAVKDYTHFNNKKFSFENNNDLEIICMPNWKIEDFVGSVDYFYNSYSFVEMNDKILRYYIKIINQVMNKKNIIACIIALSRYEKGYAEANLNFDEYIKYFNVNLNKVSNQVIWSHHFPDSRNNAYYLHDNLI